MKAVTCASSYFLGPPGIIIAVPCAIHDVKDELSKDDLDV